MDTQTWLLLGVFFGSIGLGYFMYGKKQRKPVPLICGIALMIYPYFLDRPFWIVAIGVALMAIPYFLRV
jgi:hypothetical protein